MTDYAKYHFLLELKELLDKYNVELETCGCCGGINIINKKTGTDVLKIVSTESELNELIETEKIFLEEMGR